MGDNGRALHEAWTPGCRVVETNYICTHQFQPPHIIHKGCTEYSPEVPSNCDAWHHHATLQTVPRPCDICTGQQPQRGTKTRASVDQELGPEAQRVMDELREEALRAKAKLAADRGEKSRREYSLISRPEFHIEALRMKAEIAAEHEGEKRQADLEASKSEWAKMQAYRVHKHHGLGDQEDWDLVEDKAEIVDGADLNFEENLVIIFEKRR